MNNLYSAESFQKTNNNNPEKMVKKFYLTHR